MYSVTWQAISLLYVTLTPLIVSQLIQHIRPWYVLHSQAFGTKASLFECTDLPELSLLAHIIKKCTDEYQDQN